MDNASKELNIESAVLISVMLVSVGVMIYQQAAGVIGQGQSSMDALEVQMANQIYTQYLGNKKNRNACAQLLDTASQQKAAGAEHTVDFSFVNMPSGVAATDLKAAAKTIRSTSNYTYNIEVETTDSSGYITKIKITGVNG